MTNINMILKKSTKEEYCAWEDRDIVLNGEKIGYVQLCIMGDVVYLASIDIDESQRNRGYGTEVLGSLVDEFGRFYLCPENDRCVTLYERLGEEIDYANCPDELEGDFDEYGRMFVIE